MISFEIKERALKQFLKEQSDNTNFTQVANALSINETILRRYIQEGENQTNSLSPKNYNQIVEYLSSPAVPLILDFLQFEGLVNLLDGIRNFNPPNLNITFQTTFEKEVIKSYRKFNNFITKDANLILPTKEGETRASSKEDIKKGFVEIINSEYKDNFDKVEKIGSYKEAYESFVEKKGIKLFGISFDYFLLREDDKEILLLMGHGHTFDPSSNKPLTDAERKISGLDKSNKTLVRTFQENFLKPKQKPTKQNSN